MGERFAREKRLKPLKAYLASPEKQAPGDEILAHLRMLNRRKGGLTIEKGAKA